MKIHFYSSTFNRVYSFVLFQIGFRYDIELLRPLTASGARCFHARPIVRLGAAEHSHVSAESHDAYNEVQGLRACVF